MRSALFKEFVGLSDKFNEHFAMIWQLSSNDRAKLIPCIVDMARSLTRGETEKAKDSTMEAMAADPLVALSSIEALFYVYSQWNPLKDKPEDFLRDIADLELIPEAKAEEARDFLLEFLQAIENDNPRRRQRLFARSILPYYISSNAVVDFRAVFKDPFGSGLSDEIGSYRPNCEGFVPIIVVEITCDSGDPDNLIFQCEKNSLERLIEQLQAALLEADSANNLLLQKTQS